MPVLKGITWDHPRGYQPLRVLADLWHQQTGVAIKWDVRSLKEFGDLPIERLISLYDFIIIDHPYKGEADINGLLIPLNEYLPENFLAVQEEQSVGPSFSSYKYGNNMYALPVDAAAQVSVFRKDLTDTLGWALPVDTMRLKEAAVMLPRRYFIAVPLCPTDIWCVFLTLCAQYSNGAFFSEAGIDAETGKWAMEEIRGWKSFIHIDSFKMNPVQMLEHMASKNEIIYSPFTFGYTNYSRKNFAEKLLHFGDAPQYIPNGKSSLLGGAGIAVSSKTKNLNSCLAFIQYILSPRIQKTVYYDEGGQPAHLAAWKDEKCDANCAGFFTNTLYTMQHAYVRPGVPGFNLFQEHAADIVHTSAIDKSDSGKIIDLLNNLYYKFCHEKL